VKEPTVTARSAIFCLAAGMFAQAAHAQTIDLTPADPKRWDTAVTIGWLGGNREDFAEPWNDWYDTFATSLQVGRYWTSNLKTEAGVTLTSDGDVYATDQVDVPGSPRPIFFSRQHLFGVTAVDLAGVYQPLENRWVHPFVSAGVHLAWERHRVESPFSPAYGPDGRPYPVPPIAVPQETTFDPRPFVSGGAKFYVTETGFIRTDVSAALAAGGTPRVWWRIGGGVDF
jgi:hypothetical protein